MKNEALAHLSTIEIVDRIARNSDNEALNYLLTERKLFWYNAERLLFPEYLLKLRLNNFKPFINNFYGEKDFEAKLDMVYDRTLKKFTNLKPKNEEKYEFGPYCDNQYREFLELYDKLVYHSFISQRLNKEEVGLTELKKEVLAEKTFRKLIIKHIKFSWMEACRIGNQFFKRYRWNLPKGSIELKRPNSMNGHEFRKWLESNIDAPDPLQDNESERIQDIVYKKFGMPEIISYDNDECYIEPSHESDPIQVMETDYFRNNFYETIADEKAGNISKLRPSIRRLGSENVRKLVSIILEHYTDEDYSDTLIAKKFGLSKATFHRFAGCEWKDKKSNKEVPDLWKNISKVMLSNPIFADIALSCGVLGTIEKIVL